MAVVTAAPATKARETYRSLSVHSSDWAWSALTASEKHGPALLVAIASTNCEGGSTSKSGALLSLWLAPQRKPRSGVLSAGLR